MLKEYMIYIFGTKAKCPDCSGVMARIGGGMRYRCVDCGSSFAVEGLDRREDYFLGKKLEMSK